MVPAPSAALLVCIRRLPLMTSHRFLVAVFLLLLIGMSATSAVAQPPASKGPKLLVVVSVDQFCQDYLIRFQDNFPAASESMFRAVMEQGAYFANCHHAHAFTITAPGHSVQLSGTYPGTTGIIENDWFDRTTGKVRYCVSDPTVEVVGIPTGKPMSPRVLLVDTVGDRLKLASGGRSKVFGVSIKDRAAILMTGHRADCAFWLEKNQWVTSTYYRSDLPGYMRNLNDSKAIEQFRGQTWDLLLPSDKYHNNGPDENEFENPPSGWTSTFPHKLAGVGELTADKFGDHVLFSPFGNDYTLLAARQVIEHEKLGQDEFPDLLAINFASNDYIGHAFGPLSLEVEDMTYRTDRQLAAFMAYLDTQVGQGNWTLALTADHGVAPIPEMVAVQQPGGQQALPGKRAPLGDIKAVREKLEALLRKEFKLAESDPKVIHDLDTNQVYFNYGNPVLTEARLIKAAEIVQAWLLKQPYIAAAATRAELLGGGRDRLLHQMRLSFNPMRSGDVLYCYVPYAIPAASATAKPKGTTHGSPWHYDTHVPLLLIGNSIVPGRYDRRISPAFLAPTASRLLGVDSPGGCNEDPLFEAINLGKKF